MGGVAYGATKARRWKGKDLRPPVRDLLGLETTWDAGERYGWICLSSCEGKHLLTGGESKAFLYGYVL
jgi:hypothetical protein